MRIESLPASGVDAFSAYLNRHLLDNGSDAHGYFQPMPASASTFTAARAAAFASALDVPLKQAGWRRAWVALSSDSGLVGHVDLRAHPEPHTEHRCLLGLGVSRSHHRQGIARSLCLHAFRWAAHEARLEAVDLQVLSGNTRAIALYSALGFVHTGELKGFFRIDGKNMSYTYMSLALPAAQESAA